MHMAWQADSLTNHSLVLSANTNNFLIRFPTSGMKTSALPETDDPLTQNIPHCAAFFVVEWSA